MAEDDPRVHKASEVHKRRAPKKVRSKAKPAAAAVPPADGAPAAVPPADAAPAATSSPASSSAPDPAPAPVTRPAAETPSTPPASADSSSPEPDGSEKRKAPKRKRWGLRIVVAAVVLVIAAALVFAGFAAGSRWLRYNDAHDIEGTWYVSGTDVPVAFEDGKIVFDANTAYAYTIDPQAKTISYSLGNLEGQGRYWFSEDRGTLIITDGSDYTMWSTLFDDLAYEASRLFGNEELPAGEGSIVLTHAITLSNPNATGDSPDGEAGQNEGGGESGGESADGHAGGKEDFNDLSISDVLVKEDGDEAENETGEAW